MSGNISRRNFVKMSMMGAGALALGGIEASADTSAKDVKWDEEYDVIIIGSGFAGHAAAVVSAEKGNKVLMIEKMGRIGGNSVINGGIFCVPMSPKQAEKGIKDSKELYFKDTLKAGRNLNHPEMVELMFSRANDALKLTQKCGATYRDFLEQSGGHSVPRGYKTENGTGGGIIQPMQTYFAALPNAKVKTRVKFDKFVQDDSGRVVGVEVREDYHFDQKLFDDDRQNKSGNVKFLKANKAVVLAAGGFAADKIYRKKQEPLIPDDAQTTNHPGATAGAMLEAFRIGAYPVHVSWLQFGPWASPDEKGYGLASKFNVTASFRYGISVDKKTSKRYMNEIADRKTRADIMFKIIGNDGNYPIHFCDSRPVKFMVPEQFEKLLASGALKKFDTLDALAKEYGLDAATLKQTVETYNGYVKAGKDPDFGKILPTDGIDISVPPFYAMRGVPKLHHCMGGVEINNKAQVISSVTNEPILGLYAAGEITGGSHGASRLGSNAILDCLVCGMVAGENI